MRVLVSLNDINSGGVFGLGCISFLEGFLIFPRELDCFFLGLLSGEKDIQS